MQLKRSWDEEAMLNGAVKKKKVELYIKVDFLYIIHNIKSHNIYT